MDLTELTGTKITDLDEDSMAKFFEHVNINGLLKLSVANENFISAAKKAFSSKYCDHHILVSGASISAHKNEAELCCEPPSRRRPDIKTFFEYFGEYIEKLTIKFGPRLRVNQIKWSFFKNCRNSLTELKLIGLTGHEFGFGNLNFPNVTKFTVKSCVMEEQFYRSLFRRFPATINFEFIDCHNVFGQGFWNYPVFQNYYKNLTLGTNLDWIERNLLPDITYFTNLQHFNYFSEISFNDFPKLVSILHTNPTLMSLSVGLNPDPRNSMILTHRVLYWIRMFTPNLQTLEIRNFNGDHIDSDKFPLQLKKLKLQSQQSISVPLQFSFKYLEEIDLEMLIIDDSWIDALKKVKTLKKLSIHLQWQAYDNFGAISAFGHILGHQIYDDVTIGDERFLDFSEIINLEELTIKQAGRLISAKAIEEFIFKCGNLKRLSLIDSENDQCFVYEK